MWKLFSRKPRCQTSTPVQPARCRPWLEALEDRCVPSAPGSLDPTFGAGAGYVTTSLGAGNSAATVLIQPDGKILAAGGETGPGNGFVTRYNPDGSLDTSFGAGGTANAIFPGGTWTPYLALYPQAGMANDGKIVQEATGQSTGGILLERYTAAGAPDATFGNDGEVTTAIPGQVAYSGGVVVTSTGQIVALADDHAGHIDLVRYNADGSLDSTFGQGGEVISYVAGAGQGGQSADVKADTLLLQPDGKMIAVVGGSGGMVDLIRYNSDGTLDASFGSRGVATISFGGPVQGAAIYPTLGTSNDGKILVVGTNTSTNTWALARFNADGSPDNSFGSGGELATQISGNTATMAVVIDANDRVVVGGPNQAHTIDDLARFNADGSPDVSFGPGGLVALSGTTFGSLGSNPRGIAVYPNAGAANNGDIVMVGGTPRAAGLNSAFVARFIGQTTTAYFTVTGPASVTAGTANTYTLNVYNPDGSIDTGYSGTVHVTSTDSQATLPANFTVNGGTATFSATLGTAGLQSLTATDTVTAGIVGTDSSIQVNPGAATHFSISGPLSVGASKSFSLIVTALDAYGNVVTGYTGTVHFSSSDGTAALPKNYTFKAADAGAHTFTGVILRKKGKQTLTVSDTLDGALTATDTINVT
jgi:uncharacterized delta-60 repeat protein